jgi:DNA-directed RNA polymerase subunit M/transcription elongation factor TFIIS
MPRKSKKSKFTLPKNESIPVKKSTYKIIDPPQIKPPEILMAQTLNDRMLRYKSPHGCPMCDYSPIVVCQRRKDSTGKLIYAQYRCRNCGHRWEDDNR